MKHHVLNRGISLLLILVMAASMLSFAAGAEGSNLYVTGYSVRSASGQVQDRIRKGDSVDIVVSIKDTSDGTSSGNPAQLDITKLDDSFTGGSVAVVRTSPDGAPLTYEVWLSGLRYKGVGQSLRLQVGTAGQPDSYQTIELTVTEAVVYQEPTVEETAPPAPDPAPAPMVLVSRSEISKPIEAGQEMDVTVYFQNLGTTKLRSPVVTFTPSDALTIVGGSNSFTLNDINRKKTESVTIRIKTSSTIPSPNQSLGVELKFNYDNNVSVVQGSITDKVSIPALGRESVPQPVVLVTRSPIAKALASGETADVTITFQNSGTTKLVSPVVSVTPSESLVLLNDTSTFLLGNLAPGKSTSIQVKVKVTKEISSTNQSLGTELKFGYDNGGMITQATASDKVSIPVLGKESVPQPVVLVTRSPITKPISANETIDVVLTFENAGTAKLVSPVVSVTPSDALTVLSDASTFLLPDLEPGKKADITVKVRAAKEITSSNQSLSTELKYSYDNGESVTQATASDRLNISANTTGGASGKPDAPVPNIVIGNYSYGNSSVAAGSKFTLGVQFENTGIMKVENVVLTVDGGENFTMDSSTNTYFYKSIAAGGSQSQEIPMQAVPTGKSGAQSINFSFKYDYTDGEKRTQATSDIKISVPVYQPDRFQINPPTVPETVYVGEESEVTLTYVNKGKDDIANVEASVEGDGVDTPAKVQYLGNITAGANGNFGFALTPNMEGEIKLVLKIAYENADQQVQTREFPITLRAEELSLGTDVPDEDWEEPAQGGLPLPVILALAAAAVAAVAAGAVILVRRKKAAAKTENAAWDNWEDGGDQDRYDGEA